MRFIETALTYVFVFGLAAALMYLALKPAWNEAKKLVRQLSAIAGPQPGPDVETEARRRVALSRSEEESRQSISAYRRDHWQPLLDLIPTIEATAKFGEWKGGEKNGIWSFQLPYVDEAPVVCAFRALVSQLGALVPFDLVAWREGRPMASDATFDFDSVDVFTKCKVITSIVCNSRVNEGQLVAAFEAGLISRLLRSMDRQLTT
jgi:hypothetical protein